MAHLQQLEKAHDSVRLEMVTEGRIPDGRRFRTEGSMRVLEGTHFHVHMKASFGEGLTTETETVRTPEGVWVRERDPAFDEEVFYVIPGPDGSGTGDSLLERLDRAAELLGPEGDFPGSVGKRTTAPMGSAMLEDLDRRYALEIDDDRARIDGHEGWRVVGDQRDDIAAEVPAGMMVGDRVELFIRKRDGAILEMIQFDRGTPMVEVRVTELVLDQPMDPSSFAIDAGDEEFVPVQEYPPAWKQVQEILDRAEAAREKREQDEEPEDGNDGNGR